MILERLSQLESIKDFRLRDFMDDVGLDHRQSSLFYRGIIKESREFVDARRCQATRIASLGKENDALRQQVEDLQHKARSAEAWRTKAEAAVHRGATCKALAEANAAEAQRLRSALSEEKESKRRLAAHLQSTEARATLYEQALAHLLGNKPVFVRQNPGG